MSRSKHVHVSGSVTTHSSVRLKQKRPGFVGRRSGRSRGGIVLTSFHGDDQSADGSWVKKDRIEDRERDRYYEHVVAEDGTVLRHEDEPLSEHRGHGSDRPDSQSRED